MNIFTRIEILNSISCWVKIELFFIGLAAVSLVIAVFNYLVNIDFLFFWVVFAIGMWGAKFAELIETSEERRDHNKIMNEEDLPITLKRQDD